MKSVGPVRITSSQPRRARIMPCARHAPWVEPGLLRPWVGEWGCSSSPIGWGLGGKGCGVGKEDHPLPTPHHGRAAAWACAC